MSERELDALVAEHVFGWSNLRKEHRYTGSVGSTRYTALVGDAPDGEEHEVPVYSTYIGAAWKVVAKLQADEWGHSHSVHSSAAEKPGILWHFFKPGQGARSLSSAYEEVAPKAICTAALRALGISTESVAT